MIAAPEVALYATGVRAQLLFQPLESFVSGGPDDGRRSFKFEIGRRIVDGAGSHF